ncbi:MAG TPA: serine hydrolase domain-containing protein [Burkholderiales bacterium]|nr:serine hydrolase domain-containing protein [Burkholderiales bacterium]
MSAKRIAIGLGMSIVFLTTAGSWAQGLPSAAPETVGMSSQRLARIGDAFRKEIDQGKLPGAVFLVARKGKLVYSEALGYQDKAAGKPIARDSIFRIYSMTKPLVSVAAMMLVEEGRIQLTDPVSKFLPAMKSLGVSVAKTDAEFAKVTYTQVPADREMTVQDLLRHTAGLAYGEITQNAPVKEALGKAGIYKNAIDYDARDLAPTEEVERLSKVPLAHQPGTVWEYSLASDVLGRVVEAASAERLADFLDKRLFKPLKMGDSGFWVPQDKIGRLAAPLAADVASGKPNNLIDVSVAPANDSGGAGGVSTAADYLRFTQMLLNGGQLDGNRVLSRSSVALMTSDHLGTRIFAPVTPGELLLGVPGYTFGLGFAVRQGPGIAGVPGSAGEFMWAGYAGTYFWVDPKEEIVAVYMTQAPSPIRAYYRKLFKQLVYGAIVD